MLGSMTSIVTYALAGVFVLFMILKLTKVIAWGWLWVLSPAILWVLFAAMMVGLAIYQAFHSN